jgi:CheY-like chemotaxis protein
VLVSAVQHPNRKVRAAAIEAIGRLAPVAAFPGSSRVADAVDYLLRSRGYPEVVVGDVRIGVARERAGLLATQGFDPEVADSVRGVLDLAGSRPDCELIVLDMNLAAPTSGQLLSSLRRDARSAHTPIVIVASSEQYSRAIALARQHRLTTAVLDVHSDVGIKSVLASAEANVLASIVRPDERKAQAAQMLAWLEKLGGDVNGLFPLRRFEASLIEALWSRELAASAAPLVARCGTARGQRALVELINQSTQPLELRQAAANALAKSIAQSGTLLTTGEITAQYQRYNASEREDRDVQRVLAAVLDMIEARAGVAPSQTKQEGARE